MPPEHQIDEGTKAIIELTATKVVTAAMEKFEAKVNEAVAAAISTHAITCEAKKLGAFKATVIAVIGGVIVFIGEWFRSILTK